MTDSEEVRSESPARTFRELSPATSKEISPPRPSVFHAPRDRNRTASPARLDRREFRRDGARQPGCLPAAARARRDAPLASDSHRGREQSPLPPRDPPPRPRPRYRDPDGPEADPRLSLRRYPRGFTEPIRGGATRRSETGGPPPSPRGGGLLAGRFLELVGIAAFGLAPGGVRSWSARASTTFERCTVPSADPSRTESREGGLTLGGGLFSEGRGSRPDSVWDSGADP